MWGRGPELRQLGVGVGRRSGCLFLAFLVHPPFPDSPLWEVDGDYPQGSASLPLRLMDLAKEMTKEALPIKCLEAVILGMYPSSALGGLGGGRHTLGPSGPPLPPLEGEN